MNKKLLFLAAIAMVTITHTVNAQTDAKAKIVLDAASKKMASLKTMKANFSLKLNSASGKTTQSKKGVVYMKGNKYNLDLGAQKIISDNRSVWTYMKDANEVQISKFNPNDQSISPSKLFTNFYDKEYRYKYVGTQKASGKTVDVIEMIPTSSAKQFKKLHLLIDKASSTIVGGNVWEKNGNVYVYSISGFTANPNLPESTFTFDPKKYPGVEVVDMR